MSREKTSDEVRVEFMRQIMKWCVDAIEGSRTKEEAVINSVFGVLTTLEGSGDFPYCAVIPQPHPNDSEFHRKNGEDWYPCPVVGQEVADFSVLRGEDHHIFVVMFRDTINRLMENWSEETKS